MKFFLDTANIEQIRKGVEWGIVDGVTTNPTLVAKENVDFETRIKDICELVKGPVSAEVISTDAEKMVEEARKLSAISEHIVVKVPMIPEGIKAVKILSQQGIKTNVTLVFSATQALIAAKAGASYISPFVGRLDDNSTDGMQLVEEIQTIISNYDFNTEIIVASVRHPLHVLQAALIGADIATVPSDVLEKLFKHPMTDLGLKKFLQDWENYQKNR